MTRITIEVHNEEDKRLIKNIVSRMRLKSVEEAGEKQPPTSNGKQVAELMKVLAENTSLSKIKDSVA